MLAYVLALAVGFGSLAIYIAAFFFPEVHRKNDFIWSGVGLFYALVLWVCAGRITGSLLLGQVAGVALLGWSVGQTLSLRRQLTSRSQTLPSTAEVKNKVQEKLSNLSLFDRISQMGKQVGGSATAAKERLQQNLSGATRSPSPTEDKPRVEIIDNRTPIPEQLADIPATESATDVAEVTQANPPEASRENVGNDVGGVSPISPNELVSDDVIEPTLTEEEAIALAVETTLAEGDQENIASEPMRPHPPDPEIVEAAIRDAEEKHIEASPPEPETPENPSPS